MKIYIFAKGGGRINTVNDVLYGLPKSVKGSQISFIELLAFLAEVETLRRADCALTDEAEPRVGV